VRKSVLLLATALVAVLVWVPVAGAQTSEEESELTNLSIDSDTLTDRVGLVDPISGVWSLRGPGGAVNNFIYGNPGDVPFVGDWNCDGIDTPGLYRQSDGFVYLRNSNTQGIADIRFFFGNPGDFPLAGDFNNDGCDTVSIYRASEARIYVINALGANDGGLGAADFSYVFGNPGDKPFVGDFNGDGIDTLGLHRESTGFVYFRQSHTQGIADSSFFYGDPGDRFVSGDWGVVDNVDTPAIFRPPLGRFFFRYSNTQGVAEEELQFGIFRSLPVAGSWEVKLGLAGALAQGVRGVAYGSQLNAVGSAPPFTITKTSGPAWATVTGTGLVHGVPDAEGTFNIGVRVTDSKGKVVDQTFPVTITNGCHANGNVPLGECLVLVDLFRNAGGQFWINATNWLRTDTCSWFGVTCAAGHVTSLVLEDNNMSGSIAAVPWGSLAFLQELNLQHNGIGGTLPASLATLQSLQVLDLSDNDLGPSIPTFTGPANLLELDLAENLFTGTIAGIAAETSLTLLDLGNNNTLSGDLSALTNMLNLQIVDLSDNQFGPSIGDVFGNKVALLSLNLSANLFSVGGIPPSLGFPDKPLITELDLAANQLTGEVPAELINLNTLTVPGGLTLCSNAGLAINGDTIGTPQPGVPIWDFVNARDPAWFTTCP
jgi:Leucine rich repeat